MLSWTKPSRIVLRTHRPHTLMSSQRRGQMESHKRTSLLWQEAIVTAMCGRNVIYTQWVVLGCMCNRTINVQLPLPSSFLPVATLNALDPVSKAALHGAQTALASTFGEHAGPVRTMWPDAPCTAGCRRMRRVRDCMHGTPAATQRI